MDRRQKDIMTMADAADLVVVRCEKRNSRQYATLLAENGVQRDFSISIGRGGDVRGDLNSVGAMKRFARENRVLTASEAEEPMPSAPAAPPQQPAAPERPSQIMSTDTKKNTMKLPVKTTAAPSLSPVTFYKACEWLKGQKLATVPCLEALTMLAGQHLGDAVTEDEMKLVMETIGAAEPQHWSEPTDPQAILARELLTVMKKLGEDPSPAFKRLAESLLPAA